MKKKVVWAGMAALSTFAVTAAILIGILVLTTKIPQEAIQPQMLDSAYYLRGREVFWNVLDGVKGSKMDHYADSILLGIAYQYDAEHPLESVMRSAYYHMPANENVNLLEAVENRFPANQQYLRYWHGSIAIVRPLLLFLSLEGIYVWNGVVLVLLAAVLIIMLLKRKEYVPAIAILAGGIATSVWFVPGCLEYTWMYLWTLVLAILAVILFGNGTGRRAGGLPNEKKGQPEEFQNWILLECFFLIAGMVANFLDFLTTETMTLTVPLLLILWMERSRTEKTLEQKTLGQKALEKKTLEQKTLEQKVLGQKGLKQKTGQRTIFHGMVGCTCRSMIFWCLGYGGMWILKWLLASLVLGENMMSYVTGHVEERLGGEIGVGLGRYLIGAVWNNVRCLFPWEYGVGGVLAGLFGLLALSFFLFVYRKKGMNKKMICLFCMIGLVPYVRYLVLHNHSYIHYFFTYRAQMGTVMALVLILGEWVDWKTARAFR